MPLFLDLQAIANIGGGMIIDARNFTNLELQSLAVVASKKGTSITIRCASRLTPLDLQAIANALKGSVVFDFCS